MHAMHVSYLYICQFLLYPKGPDRMRRSRLMPVALIAGLTLALATKEAAATPPDQTPQAAVSAIFAAWNTKDPQTFGSVFPPDAEYTDVVGNYVRGPQAIAELHVFPFTRLFSGATLTLTELRDRTITPDWSSLDAHWRVTGHTTPVGEPLPEWTGVMHIVANQRDGQWLPVIVHNVDLTKARDGRPGL